MSTKWQIVIILGLGLLTRFMFFGYPNETVFDEVHFGKFVSAYYTHEFYFDIHPALGKQLIAGFAKLSDFKPEFAFAEIGAVFPNKQYLVLRFLPTLASALLPLVIFLLLRAIGITGFAAFVGGLFIVFENAILTQGRFILMDSFMLLFGFLSLLFYFKYKNSKPPTTYYLLLAGLFSGLALSVKWIALSFIALPLAIEGLNILTTIRDYGLRSFSQLNIGKLIFSLIIIPTVIYFSVFVVEFSILTKSGAGDAFMSPGFQKTLTGSRYQDDKDIKASGIFHKFTELNAEMYKANQGLTATHPYSSPWYSWPLMTRPIYYWVHGDARIYLLGNPIIWLASTVAIILLIGQMLQKKWLRRKQDTTAYLLIGAYILNLLPFIGIKRVMFLYHYFVAYVFAIMILVYFIDQHSSNYPRKNSKIIIGALLLISIVTFIYFAPLSYGLDLSPKSYDARVWLDSWR